MSSAIVFAYHSVGVRCLKVLLKHGIDIPLILTHQDSSTENIWFDSVFALAESHGIPTLSPDDVNAPEVVRTLSSFKTDFFFSFYFRQMLGPEILRLPRHGAFNMHGSLLPKYRGRVPINWAVIRGETETGATLHEMTEKPDQGAVLGREKVSIGPDETAYEVFLKVTDAAEGLLDRIVPSLLDGSAPREAQDLKAGSYFTGRTPEDGRIDWSMPMDDIHNLVRGVAPPYPGAFTDIHGHRLRLLRTQKIAGGLTNSSGVSLIIDSSGLRTEDGQGHALLVLEFDLDGKPLGLEALRSLLGAATILLPSGTQAP